MDFNARFYSPSLGRFIQPDSIIPDLTNTQAWNRYSYVLNSPLMYIDPSGHKQICLDNQCFDTEDGPPRLTYTPTQQELGMWIEEAFNQDGGQQGKMYQVIFEIDSLENLGYYTWEIFILENLYYDGGTEGAQSVQYIIENNIHIKVGDPFEYHETIGFGYFTGDWQSETYAAAWHEGNNVYLNPNKGYSNTELPNIWGISLVAHEAKHIEQGGFPFALTRGNEMEAWQLGIKIYKNLGGTLHRRDQEVLNATSVQDFAYAIKHYDNTGYWSGLRLLPPWFYVP